METRDDKERIDLNDDRIGLTDVRLVSFSDNIVGYKNKDAMLNKLKNKNELK
ncbi:hypothetical protein ABG79_00645 [Caloramator mitchellensis]|uniref:Uncharacterized protein n=1 Tax=Caloramator mitchellensis TaxID=908809 RepID=A0A0R3JUQ6_CALMK|nr:hypothetical protein [Caloramator mitchellensis]KRQ87307.1 hypothetical protein ABG79_00645 [Caloramator mitchellensis]